MGTAQTGQFRTMRIISGTTQHPNHVPFVGEFWQGTCGLGAIKAHTKNSAIAAIPLGMYSTH